MDTQTPEQIEKHYKVMMDSVWLINAVIDGSFMDSAAAEEKRAAVERNVAHLELMRAKDFWTTEDMAPVDTAIAAGKAYVG
tara:strand:+ start:2616 stop:2858 length:243 start_codon:yes stop_codon:yes gene_type:complete